MKFVANGDIFIEELHLKMSSMNLGSFGHRLQCINYDNWLSLWSNNTYIAGTCFQEKKTYFIFVQSISKIIHRVHIELFRSIKQLVHITTMDDCTSVAANCIKQRCLGRHWSKTQWGELEIVQPLLKLQNDVMTWNRFPHYWSLWGNISVPVDSLHNRPVMKSFSDFWAINLKKRNNNVDNVMIMIIMIILATIITMILIIMMIMMIMLVMIWLRWMMMGIMLILITIILKLELENSLFDTSITSSFVHKQRLWHSKK